MSDLLISATGLSKHFGPVVALKDISLYVGKAEVHAIIGENGAGKSTLMKLLSGAETPDSGQITLNGHPYKPKSPAEGRHAGVAMIYQELTLADHLTVEQNIELGVENRRGAFLAPTNRPIAEALQRLGLPESYRNRRVSELSIAEKQLVEIARALVLNARVVILDEPTSSLSEDAVQALFGIIRSLKSAGISVIYISHFLEEIRTIADRYTVIRDGVSVGTGDLHHVTDTELISLMAGRDVENLYPHAAPPSINPTLNITFKDPSEPPLQLNRGEILGIAGLVGAGRSEFFRTIAGLDHFTEVKVEIPATRFSGRPSARHQMPAYGIDLLSENREEEGVALNRTIAENITYSNLPKGNLPGSIDLEKERDATTVLHEKLRIKAPSPRQKVGTLSGGNQQKVCLARLLHKDCPILILDEPTRGIDMASKSDIYHLIADLAANGKTIIFISSYLPELMGVCNTLAVMHKGRLSPKRPVAAWDVHQVMHYATSGKN